MSIRLIVEEKGIKESDRDKLARIHFMIDGTAFPDEEWVDAKEILHWWRHTLRSLQPQSTCLLHFKEGPYKVKCSRGDDEVLVECLRESLSKDVPVLKESILFQTFVEMLHRADM
ncbi:hypothetical protein [Bacillus sp. KH172YL63]|uniref:hypothetical protein n=1 Tax=Bacillus sp. KH172YL63 TaxID=2709784 RepID=UPI0013E4E07F|nr:hypothetical protein [Bacillus sp. KH172YL63]BCB05824.1 hypothetical protein KH172YL63_39570 [Bacillus sp. KH172YL63]